MHDRVGRALLPPDEIDSGTGPREIAELRRGRNGICFGPVLARRLGLEEEIEISFRLPDAEFAELSRVVDYLGRCERLGEVPGTALRRPFDHKPRARSQKRSTSMTEGRLVGGWSPTFRKLRRLQTSGIPNGMGCNRRPVAQHGETGQSANIRGTANDQRRSSRQYAARTSNTAASPDGYC